jgi:hypothetical protein
MFEYSMKFYYVLRTLCDLLPVAKRKAAIYAKLTTEPTRERAKISITKALFHQHAPIVQHAPAVRSDPLDHCPRHGRCHGHCRRLCYT